MKHGSKLAIWCLTLWAALAAQDATPESKREPNPQQSPAQQPRRVMRIPLTPTPGIPQAVIVRKVQPEYPQQAREAHIQGQVVLRVTISRDGDVSKVDLI